MEFVRLYEGNGLGQNGPAKSGGEIVKSGNFDA